MLRIKLEYFIALILCLCSVSLQGSNGRNQISTQYPGYEEEGFSDGLTNALSVAFNPDSIMQYDGWSPGPLDTISGPYGQGMVIRNNTDDVIFYPGEVINGIKDFTISFFIKLNGLNFHNNIMSCANSQNANALIIAYNYVQYDVNGILITIGGQLYQFPDTETALSDLDWHHIVITRADTLATVYVDGSNIGKSISVPNDPIEVDPKGFVIGQDQDMIGGGFQWSQNMYGTIGGLGIYHYVVDTAIIKQLAHKTCPIAGTPCDDGNLSTIDDHEDGQCHCIGTLEKKADEMAINPSLSEQQVLKTTYLIAGSIILLMIGMGIIYWITQRRKLEKVALEKRNAEEQQRRITAEKELAIKRKELSTKALQLVKKNEFLSSLEHEVRKLQSLSGSDDTSTAKRIRRMIEIDEGNEEMWDQFNKEFNVIHSDFMAKLIDEYGSFTKSQLRLIALLKMNLSSNDIMRILRISSTGLNKARYRLRKKLNLNTEVNLQRFLLTYET